MRKKYKIDSAVLMLLFDLILINISLFIGAFLYNSVSPIQIINTYGKSFLYGIPILSVIFTSFTYFFGLHRIMWTFAGINDAIKFTISLMFCNLLFYAVHKVTGYGFESSRVYIICFMSSFVLQTGFRALIRFISNMRTRRKSGETDIVKTMIVGAGQSGAMLIKDILNGKDFANYRICSVIDDDKEKIGKTIYGYKIVGNRNCIVKEAKDKNIDVIIVSVPNANYENHSDIINICSQTGCEVKTLSSIDQIINKQISMNNLRNINISDLLGREPVVTNIDKIIGYVENKTVLVTGGGGSIGSELCRQLARHNPKMLIIFDVYENNAYDIQNEIKRSNPELNLVTLIGSVRDTHRIESVFEQYHPDIVYHAAAHKHVPLMEDSPNEAIKNNVFGTLKTVQAANKYGTQKFVLISTDKAVNPTNVMGASKRMCEMIVQTYNMISKTEYVAVRFGNVLGSNGSVIPLFKKQIEEGGPVTVTDKNIIRYFMTIPEAVSLVLEAGAVAKGGEIFVLDMGKPVKIVELAEKMIILSGLKPYSDINIEFVGLRPGEKMYEEMLMDEEGLTSTDNKRIYIGHPIEFDHDEFLVEIEQLRDIMMDDEVDIRQYIKRIVSTYKQAVI